MCILIIVNLESFVCSFLAVDYSFVLSLVSHSPDSVSLKGEPPPQKKKKKKPIKQTSKP